jgi:putative colanic acid biosynthesis UDP-glucose lipid carrier transferase
MLETNVKEEVLASERKKIGSDIGRLRSYFDNRRHYLYAKRIFDIVVSLLVIIFIFSWLFPIIWLLIKLDSRGPVFFVQRRVGFLGRPFPCLKFRTMFINAEANSKQAMENDPRITRMGRFLRHSSLDEIPQFINVLAGQMSIVGPRPHMYRDCMVFSREVNAYKFRNLMKPGITGLAQVKGYRGPAQSFDQIFRRFQWDAFYIRNAGLWLDMRIVHRTAVQTLSFLVKRLLPVEDLGDVTIRKDWMEPKNVLN